MNVSICILGFVVCIFTFASPEHEFVNHRPLIPSLRVHLLGWHG